MEKNSGAESGVQLLTRLSNRPPLSHLDDILFPEGPVPGDVVQISGQSSVGKSLLLLKFLTKSLLPRSYEGIEIGGLETGVIFINTDHNISILKLVSFMEQFISNAPLSQKDSEKCKLLKDCDHIEKVILESLKRLIILKTYSSLQLEMNFLSLKKLLYGNPNISLIVIDSLTSYYWSDITNEKSIKKMDLYMKVLLEKLKNCLRDFKLVIVFITQEYFHSKQSEFSLNLINHKIDLKKSEDSDTFTAHIDSQNTIYQYRLTEKGFTWVVSACGYQQKFEELADAIKSEHPNVEVVPSNGTVGSFEVTVNDVLIYSKLQKFAFPDLNSVVNIVGEVKKGMPVREAKQETSYQHCVVS